MANNSALFYRCPKKHRQLTGVESFITSLSEIGERKIISFANHQGVVTHFIVNTWAVISSYDVDSQALHAILGTGVPSEVGKVTERNSSNENARPRKCETIVFADA